jgi:hypothetical protein
MGHSGNGDCKGAVHDADLGMRAGPRGLTPDDADLADAAPGTLS